MAGSQAGGFIGGHDVKGWRPAIRAARRLSIESQSPCRIYTEGGTHLLAEVDGSRLRVLRRAVPFRRAFGQELRLPRVVPPRQHLSQATRAR